MIEQKQKLELPKKYHEEFKRQNKDDYLFVFGEEIRNKIKGKGEDLIQPTNIL